VIACNKSGLQSLADYIQEHYNGNQSEFGRAVRVERSQVQQWLKAKKPVYVVDDKLVQVIRDVS
jgi:hypothetical protein